jgi:hypothetical protein
VFDYLIPVGEIKIRDKKDISVIIPHRGNPIGLWATIHGCEIDLINSGLTYEYIVVANGDRELPFELKELKHQLGDKIGEFIHNPPPLAPPSARQLGAECAVGETLFFFDNHCLVNRGFFQQALSRMKELGADILHSTTIYYANKPHYHYVLSLDKDFWVQESKEAPMYYRTEPYRIAMAGHGGFSVRRDTFFEIGGYGPLEMFQGWAGEESYFDLKAAMFGKTNWLDPTLIHYHYASENRGYPKIHSDNFYRNMMVAANCIGGKVWVDKVFNTFKSGPKQVSDLTIEDLYAQAIERSDKHRQWIEQHKTFTLEEVLEGFKANNVVF